MISSVFVFLAAAVISLLVTFPLVRLLNFFRIGQPVRAEGPSSHRVKSGTPTLGGIGFVAVILSVTLILIEVEFFIPYLALVLLVFAYAGIGLADDLLKIFRRKNLGLTFWQKIILQTIFAGMFAAFMIIIGHNQSVPELLSKAGFSNPYLYLLLMIFMLVGSANAANLTDGLNGLLAGTAGVAFLAFAFLAAKLHVPEALIFSLVCSGAVFSFLYFNFPKAEVFMGDVGSLALGAALAGLAVVLHAEISLIVIGGVFIAEALSVIIQVSSYKLFKRRIFKMTPLHHHFELAGGREPVIVMGFWAAAVVLGIVGVLI